MPEVVVDTDSPLVDAVAQVTNNCALPWTFVGWTFYKHLSWAPSQNSRAKTVRRQPPRGSTTANGPQQQGVVTGMRGYVTYRNGIKRNFTIRDDYDYTLGRSWETKAGRGKGYHVNVELPDEKWAYRETRQKTGSRAVEQIWLNNMKRRYFDGDQMAAEWYMNNRQMPGTGTSLW